MHTVVRLFLPLVICTALSPAQSADSLADWITALASDASGRLYAGASQNGNGIFISTDDGAHWRRSAMGYGVTSIVRTHSGTVISFAYGHGFGRYLFRMSADGASLDSVMLPFTPAVIIAIEGGRMFASSFGEGLYTSTNDGAHWSAMGAGPGGFPFNTALSATRNGVLAVSAGHGIYRSTDFGLQWTKAQGILDSTSIRHIITGNDGRLYASGYESMMYRAELIYRSADSGAHWTILGRLRHRVNAMAADSTGTVYAGSTAGIHRVAVNGDTMLIGPVPALKDVMGVRALLSVGDSTILAGAWGGVYRSTNRGTAWTLLSDGMRSDTNRGTFSNPLPFGAYISCGVVTKAGTMVVGTDSAGVFRSMDKGTTWLQSDLTAPNVTGLTLDSAGTLFAATLKHGIHHSMSDGETWGIEGNEQVKYVDVYSLASVKARIPRFGTDSSSMLITHIVHAGTSSGVYFRYDVPFDLWNTSGYIDTPTRALTSTAEGDEVYCATLTGHVWCRVGGWWYWESRGSVGAPVAVMECDGGRRLYAAGAYGVFHSDDAGKTWSRSNIGMTDSNVVSLAKAKSGTISAGTQSGHVYRSTDRGEHWMKVASVAYPVRALLFDAADVLYASSAGRLFAISPLSSVRSGPERRIPEPRALLQAFPNPFNPVTTIRYRLPVAGTVRMSIIDVLGREIDIVDEGPRQGGAHTVLWDASRRAAGVYFARLTTGGSVQTTKLMLMR